MESYAAESVLCQGLLLAAREAESLHSRFFVEHIATVYKISFINELIRENILVSSSKDST